MNNKNTQRLEKELGIPFMTRTKTPELIIIEEDKLPCLHCGELINLHKDIHLCKKPRNEWLNKQEEAIIVLEDGRLWDLKNKKLMEICK